MVYGLLGHLLVGARQRLQGLIGVGVGLAAQDGLYGLGHHGPGLLQVVAQALLVQDELAQSLQRALEGDEAVAHGHAHVAQHGRVGEVALQPAYRQFLCQECQDGVGHSQVALRVLVVYGVHLVGHGARAHLALLDLLLEVVHGDVHPEVAVQVDDDGVDAAHGVEHGGQVVVVRDLRGVLLALQPQLLLYEAVGKVAPVILRIGHMVGVQVARGTAELGRQRRVLQRAQLLLQAVDVDHHLLAQTGGRGGLSVGLGQHGYVLPLLGIVVQLLNELFQQRVVHLLQRLLHREGHAGVVDVLRRQAEVYELLVLGKGLRPARSLCLGVEPVEHLLDEVLHRLHVVVGHALYVLHPLRVGRREVAIDVAQKLKVGVVELFQLGQGQLTQADEVLNLYPHAVAHKRIL